MSQPIVLLKTNKKLEGNLILSSFLFSICTATSCFHKGKPFTILGAEKLNGCVRNGDRCVLLAIIAAQISIFLKNLNPSKPDVYETTAPKT